MNSKGFALQNDGVYASDVENSQTMSGKTLAEPRTPAKSAIRAFSKTG